MRVAAAIGVAAALLVAPAAARAEGDPQPNLVTLIADGVRGAAIAQTAERPCPGLMGGTAGLHEKDVTRAIAEGLAAPLPPAPAGPVPAELPRRVDLRSTTRTFNRRYVFVLRGGHVYFRPVATTSWAPLAVPACFDGGVQA